MLKVGFPQWLGSPPAVTLRAQTAVWVGVTLLWARGRGAEVPPSPGPPRLRVCVHVTQVPTVSQRLESQGGGCLGAPALWGIRVTLLIVQRFLGAGLLRGAGAQRLSPPTMLSRDPPGTHALELEAAQIARCRGGGLRRVGAQDTVVAPSSTCMSVKWRCPPTTMMDMGRWEARDGLTCVCHVGHHTVRQNQQNVVLLGAQGRRGLWGPCRAAVPPQSNPKSTNQTAWGDRC